MKRHLNTLTDLLFTYHLEEDTPAVVGVCCGLLQLMGLICLPILWLAYYAGCAVLWLYRQCQHISRHVQSAPPSSLTGRTRDGINRTSRRAGKIILISLEGIRDEIPHAMRTLSPKRIRDVLVPHHDAIRACTLVALVLTLTGTLFALAIAHAMIPTIAITATILIAYITQKHERAITNLIVPKK